MKNFISIILIGLLIKHGLADVSHLLKHENNGYLPPNNGLNSQHDIGQSNYQSAHNANQGYLAPFQEHSQHHHHDQHQQDNRGYLPPTESHIHQEQTHSHGHDHQHEDENRGYLPPTESHNHHEQTHNHGHDHQHINEARGYVPPTESHSQQEQTHSHGHSHQHVDDRGYLPPSQGHSHNTEQQDDRGYLPPYQKQHEDHDHHHHNHEQNQGSIDPSLQVSYYDHHAVSLQHNKQGKDNYPKEYEDNSNGYTYAPPSQAFDEISHQHHHHHHHHDSNNNLNGPQSTGSVGTRTTSQNSFQQDHHHHHHQVSHEESHENEEHHHHHQQSSLDYLPPTQSTHINGVEHVDNSQTTSFQSQENEESYQEDERGYLPPINALELPQSEDTLHTIPPAKLGLPIAQKSKNKPEIDHINVPLPIPEVGYYFIPGVRTKLPFLSEIENEPITTSENVAAIESHHHQHQHQHHQDHQDHLHQHHHHQHPQDFSRPSSSAIRIIPSVQTAKEISSQGYLTPSQVVSQHHHFADIDFPLSNQNFPPLTQLQPQDQFVNQQIHSNFKNFAQSVVHGLNNQQNQITGTLDVRTNNGYLPPVDNYHQHHHDHHQQEIYSHKQTQTAVHNQVTNLQTYMDNVNPDDSKPSAIEAYAPGMAYKASPKVPFNSFTPAGYLPPAGTSKPQQSQLELTPSIELELNDEDKKDLNLPIDNDNTVFPLAEILGIQSEEMNQIMKQLQGNVRTIQITNHHDHSVKNIRVRDSSNHAGERTIEILGQSNEAPMGDHKVLHVISKTSNPQGVHQTIKVFNDSNEVTKSSANNEYLPPSNTDLKSKLHKFRRSF